MIDPATATDLRHELAELDAEARAWFGDGDDADRAGVERAVRRLLATTLVDLARPDRANMYLVCSVAGLPPSTCSDAEVFAALALAALRCAADELADPTAADEAYALRYVTAARDALRLAELADAPKAATRAATEAREAAAFERLQDLACAWCELGAQPWKVKVPALAQRLGLSEKSVERMHAEAARLGLPLDPLDPRR